MLALCAMITMATGDSVPMWSVSEIGMVTRLPVPDGLSGITYVSGNQFLAVDDSDGSLHPLMIDIDLTTGMILSHTNGASIALGGVDLEGVAYDAANDVVFVADEADASIRYFSRQGTLLGAITVPPVLKAFRGNLGLESLTMRGDGLEMWTCNEEALENAALGVDDGGCSTQTRGSVVRLTRFLRPSAESSWTPSGQWAYQTDPVAGEAVAGQARSGVADLCVLPDGTLLVLEREVSKKKVLVLSRRDSSPKIPSFRSRLYQVDFVEADDVAEVCSLVGADYRQVRKRLLWNRDTFAMNYEGICLGPQLENGDWTLVLVSDGDGNAAEALCTLRLSATHVPESGEAIVSP